jgi:hypothetical protein
MAEPSARHPEAPEPDPQARCVCGENVTIADAREVTLPNGRAGWQGYCPECGAPLFAIRRRPKRRVLELRYGLGGEHPRTLDEVGRAFNVTRERIRQIENQSLRKLQNLAEAQKLGSLPAMRYARSGTEPRRPSR